MHQYNQVSPDLFKIRNTNYKNWIMVQFKIFRRVSKIIEIYTRSKTNTLKKNSYLINYFKMVRVDQWKLEDRNQISKVYQTCKIYDFNQ